MALPAPAHATVLGHRLAFREAGAGPPIVLLHGNPTSSYLWRGVLPVLAPHGRVIAPDLLGMGGSDKAASPDAYRFAGQRDHLDALLDHLGVHDGVVVVGHDWGGVLAFDWARRHPDAVRGIAYTETIVGPRSWRDEPEDGQRLFRALRSPEGERMVLDDNVFIEGVLAGAVADLAPADLDVYRAPYREPGESRRPLLTWAREIPFDGEPADVHDVVAANAAWMAATPAPKLFVAAEPGAILVGGARTTCAAWPAQRQVTVPAGHFVPEDAPTELAAALETWLTALG